MYLVFSIAGSSLGGCTSQGEQGLLALHLSQVKRKAETPGRVGRPTKLKSFILPAFLCFIYLNLHRLVY